MKTMGMPACCNDAIMGLLRPGPWPLRLNTATSGLSATIFSGLTLASEVVPISGTWAAFGKRLTSCCQE